MRVPRNAHFTFREFFVLFCSTSSSPPSAALLVSLDIFLFFELLVCFCLGLNKRFKEKKGFQRNELSLMVHGGDEEVEQNKKFLESEVGSLSLIGRFSLFGLFVEVNSIVVYTCTSMI